MGIISLSEKHGFHLTSDAGDALTPPSIRDLINIHNV